MNTPERKTQQREPALDWETRKAPRHIPQNVIEAVRKKLTFATCDKVSCLR